VELVKSGVISAAENSVADHQATPLADHFAAYLVKLEADGTSSGHRENVRRCLNRIAGECGWNRLADISRDSFERWTAAKTKAGMGARTRNLHRACAVAFCNWCIETDRLVLNPLAKVKQADEKCDRRRERRALTEQELTRLLYVARYRPLAEYGRETVKKDRSEASGRRTWTKKPLTMETLGAALERARHSLRNSPAFLEGQDAVGRERALIYKSLVLTGLRKGELASLTVGQVELTRPVAFMALAAADEKSREGNQIPLRSDLAADLGEWIGDKLRALQARCRERGEPIPARLPADTPLFCVPPQLFRILDRDLRLAGIPKRDERGRTVDVHALRHSFGTLLSACGVAPRVAQEAMRHSSIDLTMNLYTDPKLLDVHGAVESLPSLPLDVGPDEGRQVATAGGGSDGAARTLALGLALKIDKPCKSGSIGGKTPDLDKEVSEPMPVVVSAYADKRKKPQTFAVYGWRV
jgi:integrase